MTESVSRARSDIDQGDIAVGRDRVDVPIGPVRQVEPEVAATDEVHAVDQPHGADHEPIEAR